MDVSKVDCCGCAACSLICPKNAINMDFNGRGNYTPKVNSDLCVHCGLCEQVCTVQNDLGLEISESNVFITVARDRSVLKNSSSGGAGFVLAEYAINNGLPVCGVTYDCNTENAKHIVIKELKDLHKIQGSKYLQSMTQDAFFDIVTARKGMVFGTPCQIAGLDTILRKKKIRDNYILVDIFCHGVPNNLLWKRHLSYLKERGKIKDHQDTKFRQGSKYRIHIGEYDIWYNQDAFYTFFLRGWLKNHRCYFCTFRRKSCSDLRIGDCMAPKYKGLSFSPSTVIANTQKGLDVLKNCKRQLEIYLDEYSVVDGIQERVNMPVPENFEETVQKLEAGYSPEKLISRTMLKGRVKSFIKHTLLGHLTGTAGSDNLHEIAGEECFREEA